MKITGITPAYSNLNAVNSKKTKTGINSATENLVDLQKTLSNCIIDDTSKDAVSPDMYAKLQSLSTAPDTVKSVSDIKDLDSLTAADTELIKMQKLLTYASSDSASSDDRRRIQLELDSCVQNINSIGDSYRQKVQYAKAFVKKQASAAENGGKNTAADLAAETDALKYEKPESWSDLFGISGKSALTAHDAKDYLSAVKTAKANVETQINRLKHGLESANKKKTVLTNKINAKDNTINKNNVKDVLGLIESNMLDDNSSLFLAQSAGGDKTITA